MKYVDPPVVSLINDILDLSKIEAGRMELEVSDFNLPMAIDNAMTAAAMPEYHAWRGKLGAMRV